MKNLLGALLKAQQDFPALVTDATNPAYRSRYATLSAVQEVAFPVLSKYGLVVLQSVRTELTDHGLVVYVGATLHHVESGEETTQELGMLPARQDPQGIGSAITYGRRYLLMTMLGLVADDDDGNAASRTPSRMGQSGRSPVTPQTVNSGRPAQVLREAAGGNGDNSAGNGSNRRVRDLGRPDWKGSGEAVDWSLDVGAFEDEASARTELRRILQSIYPGRESCKPQELPAVLDAWYAEVRRRLDQKQPA